MQAVAGSDDRLIEQPVQLFAAATIHAQTGTRPEGLAVAGGRIVATGPLTDLRDRYPHAGLTDFGTATIVPGFHDAHIHLAMSADNALDADLSHAAVRDVAGLLGVVRERAQDTAEGGWVLGSRYDDAKTGPISRRELDAAAGAIPTLVTHVAAHWAVANSAALQRLGYTDDSESPPGGRLGRAADGRLDGRLYERALPFERTGAAFPHRTVDHRLAGLRRTQEAWHAAGLTSICDALATPGDITLFQAARSTGQLTLRTNFLLDAAHYDHARALGLASWLGDDRLRFAGIKAFVDGAVGGRTCHLSEPFVGTDDVGLLITDPDRLREVLTAAHQDGTTTAVHANGDAAIRLLLDVHEQIAREYPRPGLRHRIEHCSVVDDQILDRIKAADLMVVPFAGYAAYYGGLLDGWYGPDRVARMFAHRSFLDRGITVGGSSDYPCGPFEPLVGIQSMVTRRGMDDGVPTGPKQRTTAAEALAIFTVGSATVCGEESVKGRLAPGYLADFVVLGEDPLACDPDAIAAIPVLGTYVGGERVWSAPCS